MARCSSKVLNGVLFHTKKGQRQPEDIREPQTDYKHIVFELLTMEALGKSNVYCADT